MTIVDLIFLVIVGIFIYTRFFGKKLPKAAPKKSPKVLQFPSSVKKAAPAPAVKNLDNLEGLAKIKAADPTFKKAEFISGALSAFSVYAEAVNKMDEETLDALMGPQLFDEVMDKLESAKKAGKPVEIKIAGTPKAEIVDSRVMGRTAILDVSYTVKMAEFKKGAKNTTPKETTVVWTWARAIDSEDPNWELEQISKPS